MTADHSDLPDVPEATGSGGTAHGESARTTSSRP